MSDPGTPLTGGNINGAIFRVGNTVRRPAGPHTLPVHALLHHLHGVGFDRVPRPLGIDDDGREVLSFLPGTTVHPDHDELLASSRALGEVGRMIRAFHDASAGFVPPADARWQVRIPDVGADLVVHHDLAAWNLVAAADGGWGLIDWDTAAPGTRLWELAYAAHSMVPLSASPGWSRPDAAARLRVLVDAYGLDEADRRALVPLLPRRTRSMYDLLADGAATGTEPWASLWADGHGEVWGRNTAWIESRTGLWLAALLDRPRTSGRARVAGPEVRLASVTDREGSRAVAATVRLMWVDLARELYDDVELAEPGSEALVDDIARRLGQEVPAELRAFLLESDGLRSVDGDQLVYPAQQVIECNLDLRDTDLFGDLYMSFAQLVFFSDNGGGDQFGFVALPGKSDVFVWDHESDSRYWVAGSLRDYLLRRAAGEGDSWFRD